MSQPTQDAAQQTKGAWWERERVSYVADVQRLKRDATKMRDALELLAKIEGQA
jgi:hypothetical protein